MKNIIITLLATMLALQASAQTGKLYRGTINKTIKITLYLEGLDDGTNADPIVGGYKYDGKNSYLLLNGYRNNNGNVVLVEQGSANFTGVFLGTFRGKNLHGKWFSDDYKKQFSFELIEVQGSQDQKAKFKDAIQAISAEFRNY